MRRRREDHLNHEAWAIPYGDLITLLLAFFVVMYAISSVNEGKYRVLSDALKAEFRGQPRAPQPIQVGEKQRGSGADVAGHVVQPARSAQLQRVADDIEAAMVDLIKADLLAIRRAERQVEVEIRTDILFDSGAATLSPLAMGVLAQLADTLKSVDNSIRVEGHTDSVPINTLAFPSNWELSAARAATVVHLFTKRGVDPKRLTVVGLGANKPAQSNDTPEGRRANRRVVLIIEDEQRQTVAALPTPIVNEAAMPTAADR